MTKTSKNPLSGKEQRKLIKEIRLFSRWLKKIGIPLPGKPRYKTAWIRSKKREDWVMWVQNPAKKEVQFNSYLRSKSSFSYFVSVILHECFHLFAHDLPNKSDAKRLRDDFGEEAMRVLDIEADFFVAEYLRHTKGYNLHENLGTFYDGGKVFGEAIPTRCIGSGVRGLECAQAHSSNSPLTPFHVPR